MPEAGAPPDDLDHPANLAAGRRLFVGTGASAPPVQDAAFRFVCAGWPTEAPAT